MSAVRRLEREGRLDRAGVGVAIARLGALRDGWVEVTALDAVADRAFGVAAPTDAPDPSVTLEAIVCGLLQPHGVADGRLFKLVVRILQSGQVDTRALSALARRERSDHVLAWLLDRVPEAERNGPLEEARAAIRPLAATALPEWSTTASG
jgi:hypothetical protein